MRRFEFLFLGVFVVLLVGGQVVGAGGGEKLKDWVLKGELGKAPARVTETYPLSDQANEGGWVAYEAMSDEFDGPGVDKSKWWDRNPRWLGRQPAWFYDKNVTVSDGKLHLAMKKAEPVGMPKDKGYHTYTSAAVQSRGRVLYGYFEVKCRPMKSAGSSSFWFYYNTPELWTEIDVFEIGGKAKGFEKKYNMNVHVFRTPEEKQHWSKHGEWYAPTNLADDYHVYALEWDKEQLKWYFDGVLVRRVENTHWHQALTLNFDSETMGDWFGLPKDEDLPSTYSIEYMRTWKHRQDVLTSGKLIMSMLGAEGIEGMTAQDRKSHLRAFGFMDDDGDGKVDRDQYVNQARSLTPEARRGLFSVIDRNRDGYLTELEYVHNRVITDEARRIVEGFDKDGNGRVTTGEFVDNCPIEDKEFARQVFGRLDTDSSGDITVAEYLTVWVDWAWER